MSVSGSDGWGSRALPEDKDVEDQATLTRHTSRITAGQAPSRLNYEVPGIPTVGTPLGRGTSVPRAWSQPGQVYGIQRTVPAAPRSVTSSASSKARRLKEAEFAARQKVLELQRQELIRKSEEAEERRQERDVLAAHELAAQMDSIEHDVEMAKLDIEGSEDGEEVRSGQGDEVSPNDRTDNWVAVHNSITGPPPDAPVSPPVSPDPQAPGLLASAPGLQPMAPIQGFRAPGHQPLAPMHGPMASIQGSNQQGMQGLGGAIGEGIVTALAKMGIGGNEQVPRPTKLGLRARKPVDLPIFDGNPLDWPLFQSQFRMTTKTDNVTEEENIYRLQKCLKGKAKEAVQSMLLAAGNAEMVIGTLELNFGRPELVVKTLVQKVRSLDKCKDGKPEMLIELSNAVLNLVTTMESVKCEKYMAHPDLIEEITSKFSVEYRAMWFEAFSPEDNPNLKDMSKWLRERATRVAAHCTTIVSSWSKKEHEKKGDHRTSRALPAAEDNNKKCLCCNKSGHSLEKCFQYQKMDGSALWGFVQGKKICYGCLKYGHLSKDCESGKICGENGCTKGHHPRLHGHITWSQGKGPSRSQSSKKEKPKKPEEVKTEDTTTVHVERSRTDDTILSVVPVTVMGPEGEFPTFALLDSGAKHTFIDSAVSKRIGVTGPKKAMRVLGFGELSSVDNDARRVKLRIRGPSKETFELENVVSMKDLLLPIQTVNIKDMKSRFQHLKQVPLSSMTDGTPTILIGQDNFRLMSHQRVVEGKKGEPIATLTRLGWVLQGRVNPMTRASNSGVVLLAHDREKDALHQMVKESFLTENFGVKLVVEPRRSVEDTRALKMMEGTSIQKQVVSEPADKWMLEEDPAEVREMSTGRWETCLPWKTDNLELPESKSGAMGRLKSVERKMDANPKFGLEYCEKIQAYIDKGFARKLEPKETAQERPRTWYLPHFDVHNPNKPGKWRLVFDGKAKCHGVSLNDALVQGPDLLKPLPVILCKFRQKKIGFTGDIKDFFHRVLIRPEDSQAQRFLWRGMDRDRPPDIMEMSSMIFGAVSSPFCAQFVRNKNAQRFSDFPKAVEGIMEKHYIDDYLDCADTEEEALQLIKDVTMIHRKGGFQIIGWTCSSRKVLAEIPEEAKANGQKDLEPDSELPMARVLGLHWDPNQDVFTFLCKFSKVNDNIINGNKTPTKREMLKLVMSVFDPLGFLAHFTIKARILLQEVWRSDVGWDQEVANVIFGKWRAWLEELNFIPDMKIPRCYSPQATVAQSIQLHLFCDASEKAFAAVAYIRVDHGEAVDVAFGMAKTRVAPLKSISIPRLELQAAVMASRLATTMKESHDLKFDETHFWSDSKTVLCWIRSDSRNYKPFVSHRIGEIHETSEAPQWHWLPSAENVADDATRDELPCEFGECRWVNGPSFLKLPCDQWPQENVKVTTDDVSSDVLELKTGSTCLVVNVPKVTLPEVTKYSSFVKLVRITAWMFRFARKCRKEAPTNTLCREQWRAPVIQCQGGRVLRRRQTSPQSQDFLWELWPDEMYEAEKRLWIQSQWMSFPEEMAALSSNKPLPSSSRLTKLSPYMEDGVLRLKGRIDQGKMDVATKRPVILDPKHPFTRLLVHYYHVRANHQGQEQVVNELRQKYWILNMRAAIKSAWNACLECKIQRAKPVPPEMGQLPEFRLKSSFRPFVTTGVDYFGPMDVTIGRRHEKRYGALFTCLTTRAVHLEIAASLTTDSAIMTLRRLIGRRGCPKTLYSDNGTNFRGADTELQKSLAEIDWAKMQAEFAPMGMEWSFIPPSAPHMGGCWERLVRSVKTALKVVLKERAPKEEVLQTLFVEAENIVNSRPLTHVSVDPDDPESLTPNHFLIGSSNGAAGPGEFSDTDLCLRKQWRISQRLADLFWQRWVKEYLPTLTKRTKWFKKAKPVQVGDLVLVADGDLPRNSWPRGIVKAVFPGADGQVRAVDVETSGGIFRRPVVKLCVLDLQPKDGAEFDDQPVTASENQEDLNETQAIVQTSAKPAPKKCRYCQQSLHPLENCIRLQTDDLEDKWRLVVERYICYCCLDSGHSGLTCPKKKVCCETRSKKKLYHHPLLHNPGLMKTNQ